MKKDFSGVRIGAFTLAEILIVLGIIGIIAELTIPSLIQDVNEKVRIVGIKKAYSVLSQAYTMATLDNGTPDGWNLVSGGPGALILLQKFSPYLKITQNCGNGTGCLPTPYKYLYSGQIDIDATASWAKAQLADGTLILFEMQSPTCNMKYGSSSNLQNVCADIFIDVNGFKPPNRYGIDWVAFWITANGIIPFGTSDTTDTNYDFNSGCKSLYGFGCTAWIIYNGNQDYLKPCGSNLSWEGLTSCN